MNEKNELQKHEPVEDGHKHARSEKQKGKAQKKERGRRWLFLVVDLLLLAVIVGAAIFIVSVLTPDSEDSEETEMRQIVYQIEIAGVESDLFTVTGGETVVDAVSGAVIGVVEYHDGGRPYTAYIDSATERDGKYFATEVEYPEDIKTYLVTVRVTADFEAGVGYSADGCRIAVGREYQLRFANYTGSGVCVSLQYNDGR